MKFESNLDPFPVTDIINTSHQKYMEVEISQYKLLKRVIFERKERV